MTDAMFSSAKLVMLSVDIYQTKSEMYFLDKIDI